MRVNFLLGTLVLLALACSANGLNILAIFPYDGRSHFLVFKVLLHHLAHKGHNLTVISHFPEHKPPPNYRDINLYIPPKQFTPEDSLKLERSYWNILEVGLFLATNGRKNCKILLANKDVQDIVKQKAKYDVILTDEFNSDCALGLAYKIGGPVVRLTSHVLMPWHYARLGIPYNPAYVPFHFLEGGDNPTLWFDLKTFIDRADKGIIYISFGTTVRISNITLEKTEAILGAIEEMPQQFIWRWDKYASFSKPPFSQLSKKHLAILNDKRKFFTGSWLPQVDILSHPKILGFLSHGGMGGTTEAIHYGVPILVTPVTGDQPANAASIEESGFGVQLPVNDISKDTLVAGMKKILEPEFREKVKRMSKAWHDRPLSPMDTAVYWIEYAARNPDLTYRTKAADVPLYQYLNLDIVFVFSVFATILVLVIKLILWFRSGSSKKESSKKKKQ